MLKSSPMILASIFHLWPGSHEAKWFAGPPKLQISLSYCPTRLLQSKDGRCRPCVLRLGSNEATPCKGNQERPATKMPKEAILNFTSPPASSCIKNNQCKVLGSKWFSILAASADAEISSPPPTSFQLIKRHGPEMDTWIKPEETSPFGGFHKKWGYRKMDSWLLIWSYMIKSTKIGWFFFGDQFFWMETPICFHWKEQIFKTDDLYRASIARKRLSAVSTHLSCARFLPYWTGGFAVT